MDLFKQKKQVSGLTTEKSAANARISELKRELQTSTTNRTTAQNSEPEATTAILHIQGTVINLTRDLNDSVRNSVAAARVLLDAIPNPTDGALAPDPGTAPPVGAAGDGN